ncbi:NAD(P)/FAD-dependent oxidoreductase [Paenibacillus montanisoli]|uniref:Pyridine nucleotide-disulfide oxidoreductase n=1 Tax=Paenibacillus montanisoli TaxID=2081970 RepID=A0A328TZZ2_9BACL|nr:NAD(P)/FAD-dependent oxidoreductase [Paenibacillus montanisoli]RAP74165.1 pyridine nucleotide-disulfide oxidoreductase [Paenibacillus montanisoli]
MMDCIIIGGGIAGLQAAIQLGRYAIHNVLVIDAGDGRSAICRSYRNLLGYPEGVSGTALRQAGRSQLAAYGIEVVTDTVMEARPIPGSPGGFELRCSKPGAPAYQAKTLLIATGVMDRLPDYPELRPCLGLTVFVCPDCDGYEIRGRSTIVLGAGDVGARMALTLRIWTDKLLYIDQAAEQRQAASGSMQEQLAAASIAYRYERELRVNADCDGNFHGVILPDGTILEAERAFVAYGGNEVKSSLAKQLGAKMHENSHIWNDPRSKMTSVPGVWAAGDVAVHSEQVSIAMGEGAQAAIWIHKTLLGMRQD